MLPSFLITATAPSGTRETIEVNAENSQDACRDLESRGYRDIALHTNDVFAALSQSEPNEHPDTPPLLPREKLTYLDKSKLQLFVQFAKSHYRQSVWSIVIVTAIVAYLWAQSGPNWFTILLLVAMYVLPLILAGYYVFQSTPRWLGRLGDALEWGRWEEILELLPTLRGEISEAELHFDEACALAGLGRRDAAIAAMVKYRDHEDVPPWLFQTRLARVYGILQMEDKVIDCERKAYEAAPEVPQVIIGLALAYLTYEKDLEGAKELIASAEQRYLTDYQRTVEIPLLKGMAALNAGDFQEAERFFRSLAARDRTGLESDIESAFLAVALAHQGKMHEAERLFQRSRARLVALNSKRLLARWERAIQRT